MSNLAVELNDTNFDSQIRSGVTLVDFWAPWCGPCRMQGPILDRVATQIQGKATVAKVNVDSAPGVAATYGVQSIPTLIVFRNGDPRTGIMVVCQSLSSTSESRTSVQLPTHNSAAENRTRGDGQ